MLILFSIVQIVAYYLYNGKFHPFALIVMSQGKASSHEEKDSNLDDGLVTPTDEGSMKKTDIELDSMDEIDIQTESSV